MPARRTTLTALIALALAAATGAAAAAPAPSGGPRPGSPAYVARDLHNMTAAYGRQLGPHGQLTDPAYPLALAAQIGPLAAHQLAQQAAEPTRPSVTAGNLVPGWNIGNPLRAGWAGHRGTRRPVAFTNRFGALLRGDVFAPKPGARDPYTGRRLHAPYPGVVITPGSVQGSERMYWWLAEDLAERGYVVLTFDVQGEGTSETLPHHGPAADVPFCMPLAKPAGLEMTGCPGVPFQQPANFIDDTLDATSFFLSTPAHPWRNPAAGHAHVDAFNPLWQLFDHSPDPRTVTPGRTTRLALVGHSLGAFAVSYVQGIDPRVQTVVALDKLDAGANAGYPGVPPTTPRVPALAVQSEYGFAVTPYTLLGGSSFVPQPVSPTKGPDPAREEKTGFDGWRHAGLDTMLAGPAGLDPPGIHRHPLRPAGLPLRAGPGQRLRAALARRLPATPAGRPAGPARPDPALPGAGGRRHPAGGHAAP